MPKQPKLSKEEQQALDDLKKDKELNEQSKKKHAAEREKEDALRAAHKAHEQEIKKTLEKCKEHLRGIAKKAGRDAANEVVRRLAKLATYD